MTEFLREIWRKRKVLEVTGRSSTTLWRLVNSDDPKQRFPAPVKLGARSIGFYSDEVIAWVNTRPRSNDRGEK